MLVCKKCRRSGEKLFLKGEKCLLPKCPMNKKNYPPGAHGGKGQRRITDYGVQLAVKQRLKRVYGIRERQLRKYFDKVKNSSGNIGELFLKKLELRLDNVVYRSGLADYRRQARQMVNHGFFYVKGRKVNIPSYEVKEGEEIKIRESKAKKNLIIDKINKLKKSEQGTKWIFVDCKQGMIKVIDVPNYNQVEESRSVQMVIEYYSR